ncbi:MAG: bacteriocin immunity protein [Liquorilactobacillus nagelii]|uniref:bacteriocin immunity protein n=1 Tax=Liquorilactobacillus nagelii TaxID=82688 RepID=UPI0039ECF892
MKDSINDRQRAKELTKKLLQQLDKKTDRPAELLDIIDVLLQVYTKLDQTKDPAVLINHFINYLRSTALKGKLHFPPAEEKTIIELEVLGQKAGINGNYLGGYTDKSQFYSIFEHVPQRD